MFFDFSSLYLALFGYLPYWFSYIFLVFILVAVAFLVFKLVAFVMDVLPFI